MKTKASLSTKAACMFMLLLTAGLKAHAQKSDTLKHRYFSFGIRASKDLGAELTNPVMSNLILNIDPVKYARLELQYGKYSSEREEVFVEYTGQSTNTVVFTPDYNASNIAFGVFGMIPIEKSRVYLGYRYTKISSKGEYVSTVSGGYSPAMYTTTGDDKSHSVVLGGEHFFGSRFSLGAEFALHALKTKSSSNYPGSRTLTGKANYTDASLVLRFYLL